LRTHRHCLGLGETAATGTLALGLTGLAALGFVLEVLIVEEVLFSRRENEISPTIYTLKYSILKIRHGHSAPLNNLNML
jgi:hypothetical protein